MFIAVALVFPALVIWLCYRVRQVDKLGAVLICYLGGILLGNTGLLSESIVPVQDSLTEVSVALSLPLLLFSLDIRRWTKVAGKAMLSMFLAVVAVVLIASAGVFIILPDMSESWQVAGMAVGVYTGGTPNVAAIKTALDIDPALFVVVHSYDTIMGALYILFCVTLAQRFFLLFLPRFKQSKTDPAQGGEEGAEGIEAYCGFWKPRTLLGLFLAIVVSLIIVGLSLAISGLAPEDLKMAVVILAITTLSIVGSMIGPIHRIEKTFQLGMYVIYVFCFVVGSMARFETLAAVDPAVVAYITFCVFGTMALHALLARLFKIDADTFIITSVAAVCSPPFVPVVAGALRNRLIVLSGLTTGIMGYAIGNYLGITIGLALRALLE